MTSNIAITKIESMTENYPEFLVANLNYVSNRRLQSVDDVITNKFSGPFCII
jgi:hypothetical protein